MCTWGDTVTMELAIPAYLSHTGKEYKKTVAIDRCIAPLVKALNDVGLTTINSQDQLSLRMGGDVPATEPERGGGGERFIRQTAKDRQEELMYVKIARYLEDRQEVSSNRGDLERKVVPSEHYISECVGAHYKKVAVSSMFDFHELMSKMEPVTIITPIPEKDSPFEFVQVRLVQSLENHDKLVDETLIARDCTLYLMNNEGKTIDSIVCR